MILCVDMGGTKCVFALYKKAKQLELFKTYQCPTKNLSSLTTGIKDFLGDNKYSITKAGIALAGVIHNNTCYLPNLNLSLDLAEIKQELNFIPQISFYNDMEAMIYSTNYLPRPSLLSLKTGEKTDSTCLSLLAPGTGLGEVMLLNNTPIAGEGGHGDFAPQTKQQFALLEFLQNKYGHICYEQILSGPGIMNIFDFIKSQNNKEHLAYLPEQISKKALLHTCPLCEETYQLFLEILGAEAGNLALRSNSFAGVYLGGGILPKILPLIQNGTFIKAFLNKGKYSFIVEQIPVYLILNQLSVVIGAGNLVNQEI